MASSALIRVKGILVDGDALRCLRSSCDPSKCKGAQSCCSVYEVCVNKAEMKRIAGMIPASAAFAPNLRDGDAYANPFEEADPGEYSLDTDEAGTCVFGYRARGGELLCSIHSAALKMGLDPFATKPRSCSLWPLALSEDTPPVLGVQEGIERFACIRIAKRPCKGLAPVVAELVAQNFGAAFLTALVAKLEG